jgi:flagellin
MVSVTPDGVPAAIEKLDALNETSTLLIRMRELAIQSANGTLGPSERATVDLEFQGLRDEINRIAAVTEFNGTLILQSASSTTFQIGTGNTVNDRFTVSAVNAGTSAIGLSGVSVTNVTGARSALALLDSAISQISSLRAAFGTAQNRLESAIRSIGIAVENTAAAESRIRDVDFASETAERTRNQLLQQAGISVLAQANISTQSALALLQ